MAGLVTTCTAVQVRRMLERDSWSGLDGEEERMGEWEGRREGRWGPFYNGMGSM